MERPSQLELEMLLQVKATESPACTTANPITHTEIIHVVTLGEEKLIRSGAPDSLTCWAGLGVSGGGDGAAASGEGEGESWSAHGCTPQTSGQASKGVKILIVTTS